MRRFRVSAAVLLACGAIAASVAGASPAAAGVTPTSIGFGVSPPALTYGSTEVTLSGTLSANNAPVTIAGEQLTIEYQQVGEGAWVPLATATTDATGNFSTTANLAIGGNFEAEFAGDTVNGYGSSTSDPVNVASNPATVTITLTSVPKAPVLAGAAVKFAGTVMVTMPDDTLRPLSGAPTDLYRSGVDTGVHTTSAKDGSFSLTVKPSASGDYEVEVIPADPWPYNLYGESISQATHVTVDHKYQTRVLSFAVPAKHEIHSTFRISGTVQARTGPAWTRAGSVWVGYYYRVLPSTRWIPAGGGRTNAKGVFSTPVNVRLGHAVFQVRVKPQQHGNTIYLPSTSGTHKSFIVDRTCVAMPVALHLHGATDLAAVIEDWCPPENTLIAIPSGVAKFYYHPKGSTTWRYLGSSRTRAEAGLGGDVGLSLAGTVNGYFRIVFPAQGNFLGSVSKTLHLG